MYRTMYGAPLRRTEEGINRWVLVRGAFRMEEVIDSGQLNITADGRYRLWLNGRQLGYGPVRSNPAFQRVDSYDIGNQVKSGENIIAVLMHVPGRDLAWYEAVKTAWQPVFGDGALYVRVVLKNHTKEAVFLTDESWRILESDAWTRNTPQAGWGQDFIEEVDGRLIDPRWIEAGFDDSNWPHARLMRAEPSESDLARGWGVIEPFPILIPSITKPASISTIYPARLVQAWLVEPRADLPLQQRLYAEEVTEAPGDIIDGAENLLKSSGSSHVHTLNQKDVALMFAFEPYQVGRPFIEFNAEGGEILEIAVSESLPGEFGRGIKGDALRGEDNLWVAHLFRYVARKGRQRFEKFTQTGIRAMQLVVRNAPNGIVVREVGVMATHYPAVAEGDFTCSDSFLNQLWNIGRHTVLMCAQDAWVDCPGRESRQWHGDGIVMFDVAAMAFGPSIYPLHRQFLEQIIEGQRRDGLIRMVSPGDFDPEAVTIIDGTLLWIIGVARYYRATGDLDLVEKSQAAIERALGWFDRLRASSILIADIPEWHFIEWAHVGRQGYSMPINALYCAALKAASDMAKVCERPRLAGRYELLSIKVAEALNLLHWDEERRLYVDSVDPSTKRRGRRLSQHANALAILCDIAPKERWPQILKSITDTNRLRLTDAPPIVTKSGVFDEERHIVRANSFFAHFVYDGIAKAGGYKWVLADFKNLYGSMMTAGSTTLWESSEPFASLCHGFSATPVYQLSRHCLGVEPLTPGYGSFTVNPQVGSLEFARGEVPTPHGRIHVSWQKRGRIVEVEVRHPEVCEFVVPALDLNKLAYNDKVVAGEKRIVVKFSM